MPTDLLVAARRRAAKERQENIGVLLVPVLMCILTLIASLESPAIAAGFRLYGMF